MGEALSKWIEGSLSAMGELESERDRQTAMLEAARRDAAAEKEAIEELDRHITQFTRERKKHRDRLMGLEHEIMVATDSLEGLQADLAAMALAIEKVGAPVPKSAPPKAPAAKASPPEAPAAKDDGPSLPAPPPAKSDDLPTSVRKKTVIPPPPSKPAESTQKAVAATPGPLEKPPVRDAAPAPSKTAPPTKTAPPSKTVASKTELGPPSKPEPVNPELELGLDELEDGAPKKKSGLRVAVTMLVVLGVLAGGGYAAVQTEMGARIFEDMRSGVQGLLGS